MCDDGDFQAPARGLGASDWSGRDRLISASITLTKSCPFGVPGFLSFPKILRNAICDGPSGRIFGFFTQVQFGPPMILLFCSDMSFMAGSLLLAAGRLLLGRLWPWPVCGRSLG